MYMVIEVKNIKYIIIALVVIIGVLIFVKINVENSNMSSNIGTKELTEIDYDEFSKLVENKEDFILMVGSSTCPHCAEFKPRLELYNYEYDLDIKYIVVDEVPSEFLGIFLSKAKMSIGNENGTPKTIYFEEGIMQSYPKIYGAKDNSDIESFLKGAGVINGD